MAQAISKRLASSLHFICNREPTALLLANSIPKIGGVRSVHDYAIVGGVEIPNTKKVEYSLQYIRGIGRARAPKILSDLSIDRNKKTGDLSEIELMNLRDEVSKYIIEEELRRLNVHEIERLKNIECYRGVRHQQGLPCRGQRTKTNCRTLKGKGVAIAGKKKPPR